MRRSTHILPFLGLLLLAMLMPGARMARAASERCFTETGQCLSGRFLQYWEQNGGLPVFGFPIAPARDEVNRDTGQSYLTQWLERNRFELHPENAAPYDVLLGRLGDDRLRQQGIDWQTQPREDGPRPGCLWFAQTGHNVCDQGTGLGFKTYWQKNGLLDMRLDGFGRSLALFGLPLTAPRVETNSSGDRVLTQWFERTRFEWHPDEPDQYKVLLGLLGNEVRVNGVDAPKRGRIAFTRDGDIYVTSAGGGDLVRLTRLPAPVANQPSGLPEPVWSPDGESIAFMGGDWELYVVSVANGSTRRLTDNKEASYFRPAWSPDGQRIIFDRDGDIYQVDVDDGTLTNLTKTNNQAEYEAAWSPDGKRIVFLRDGDLYVMNADSSHQRRLTQDLQNSSAPQWSPDNHHIVFTAYPQRGNGDIYLIDADGSGLVNLTDSENINDTNPIWSPNGQRIAFETNRDPEAAEEEIYVMDPDGGQPSRLTINNAIDTSVSWSPDGQSIVFASDRGGSFAVYAMKANGADQTFLAEGQAPAWSPK